MLHMKQMWIAGLFVAFAGSIGRAERLTYYVSRDVHETLNWYHHANNTYVGLPNPNYQRLTFIYAHWVPTPPYPVQANHAHGRSNYFYTGPIENPTIVNDSPQDNVIPEFYTGYPPLKLRPATGGTFDGKLTSYVYDDTSEETGEEGHYSPLTIASIHELDGFAPTTAEYWMRNGNRGKVGGENGPSGSVGRYSGSLIGGNISLVRVSLSPGLHVGVEGDLDIFDSSDEYNLGNGQTFRFTPVFWTESDAAIGNYRASLMFRDLNSAATGILDSGVFHIDFRVVPEPASALMLLIGAGFLARRRIR